MLISEMTQKECREFLASASVGRLACVRDNHPYIVPIYFAYEPDHLYGFTTLGRKIEWMRRNPNVCVEVDEVTSQFRWKSVILNGRYAELTDEPAYHLEREQARLLLERRFLWWQTAYAAMQLRGAPWHDPAIFYCIHIDSMTGHVATQETADVRELADESAASILGFEPVAAI